MNLNRQRNNFLAIILLFLLPMSISAESVVDNGITYSLNSSNYTATLTMGSYDNEVVIPETVVGTDGKDYSVTTIAGDSFTYFFSLEKLTISSSVTSIGDMAFFLSGSDGSDNFPIYLLGSTPPALGVDVFLSGQTSEGTVYIPEGSLSAYQSSDWAGSNFVEVVVDSSTGDDEVTTDPSTDDDEVTIDPSSTIIEDLEFAWANAIDGPSSESPSDLKVSSDGKILALSSFGTSGTDESSLTVSYNGEVIATGAPYSGTSTNANLLLQKLDTDGTQIWSINSYWGAVELGSASAITPTADGGAMLALKMYHTNADAAGNSILLGLRDAAGNETDIVWEKPSVWAYQGVLVRVDGDGNVLWTKLMEVDYSPEPNASSSYTSGTPNGFYYYDMVMDSSNNVYIAGNFRKTMTFVKADGTEVEVTPRNIESWTGDSQSSVGDLFIVKLDENGNYLNHLVTEGDVIAREVIYALDYTDDKIYMAGIIKGSTGEETVTLGGKAITPTTFDDILITSLNENLSVNWVSPVYALASSTGVHMTGLETVSVYGDNVYVGGRFTGGFGTDKETSLIAAASTSQEAYVINCSATDGAWIAGKAYGAGISNIYGAFEFGNSVFVHGYKLFTGTFLVEYDKATWTQQVQYDLSKASLATAWSCVLIDDLFVSYSRSTASLSSIYGTDQTVTLTGYGSVVIAHKLVLADMGKEDKVISSTIVEGADADCKTVTIEDTNIWVIGNYAISAEKLILSVGKDGSMPEIIIGTSGSLTADTISLSRSITAEFNAIMSLPFAFNLEDITVDGNAAEYGVNIIIYQYDAAKRAAESTAGWTASGWVQLASGTIAANEAFAVAVSSYNGDVQAVTFTATNVVFTGEDKEITLAAHVTAIENVNGGADADWNNFGNPYLQSVNKTAGYVLYSYNAEKNSYDETASVETSTYTPYAGVFAQRADGFESVAFSAVSSLYQSAIEINGTIKLTINGDDDVAKMFIVDGSSADYVTNEDAMYFGGANSSLSQIYFVDQNGRSIAATVIPELVSTNITYVAAVAGTQSIAISTDVTGSVLYLQDSVTGTSTLMTDGTIYEFETEAGTVSDRFALVVAEGETTGVESAVSSDVKVVVSSSAITIIGAEIGADIAVYSVNGTMLYSGVVTSSIETISTSLTGVLIVKVANEVVKVVK